MIPEYRDFVLVVQGKAGAYSVEAEGPGGVRVPPARFDWEETRELRSILNHVRAGLAPERAEMEAMGTALFEALFPRPVLRAFERAHGTLAAGTGLRLKLLIRPPELGDLPWELLYDPDGECFLSVRLSAPIVRFVDNITPAASLLARRPLRVLHLLAAPPGTAKLDLEASEAAVREGLGASGKVEVLRAATPAELRAALREQPGYHVLHYDGHGAFGQAQQEGYLILQQKGDRPYPLSGEMLAGYLDGTSVRLVVLAACHTAVDAKRKRLSGVAGQIMRAGRLPAAVAMQFEVADNSTPAFTREFYKALTGDYPVDAALIEGRKAILDKLGGDALAFSAPDWAAPVLFLRVPHGDILREEMEEAQVSKKERGEDWGGIQIDTGGGPSFVGDIHVEGGDFVAGRKIVVGDEVHGDKVAGDKVLGDKISAGNISDSTVAMGRHAQATHTEGVSGAELARLLAEVYRQIEARPADPDVDKEELAGLVQQIEQEAGQGEAANPNKVERWLGFLGDMAPDIADVVAACLIDPLAGVAAVIRNVARRARGETG